jgi:hypothetical protein
MAGFFWPLCVLSLLGRWVGGVYFFLCFALHTYWTVNMFFFFVFSLGEVGAGRRILVHSKQVSQPGQALAAESIYLSPLKSPILL